MKALVINADPRSRRMAFQAAQLQALGIEFARWPAITPQTLAPPAEDPFWEGWERPLSPVEKAIFCSHRAIWQAVGEGRDPVLVLEDDAVLARAVPDFLRMAEGLEGVGRITLEVRGRRKLVARDPDPRLPARRLWQDRTGAAAYILWPSGARALAARAASAPGLADAVLCAAYEVPTLQAWPALAVQADMCAHYRLRAPFAPDTANPQPPAAHRPAPSRAQRRRRLAAQLRMGWRRLQASGHAAWCEVPIARDWPPVLLP